MVLGWSRASALRHCHLGAQRPFPSGFGKRAPDRESSGNPVASLGGGGCWCNLAGSPTFLLVLLQPWPAPLPIGHFLGVLYGEIGPTCKKVQAFSFFFFELFYFYLKGLSSLAHDTSPPFLVLEALKFSGKRKSQPVCG